MKGIDSALHDLSELTESELKASRLPEPQKQSAPLRKSGSGRGDGGINGKRTRPHTPSRVSKTIKMNRNGCAMSGP